MQITFGGNVSPACDPALGTRMKTAALTCQAHRTDVLCEGHRGAQKQQGDVVIIGDTVVLGVVDDLSDVSGDLIDIDALLRQLPQIHNHARSADAGQRQKMFICSSRTLSVGLCNCA